jgi:hypothetical protein
MADYEHGDYNWSDDLGSDEYQYGLEEPRELLTYDQMIEGYEDEPILTHTPISQFSQMSTDILCEYLISTNQTSFQIVYDGSILASGLIEKENEQYKISVNLDIRSIDSSNVYWSNTISTTHDIRQAIDVVLQSRGNTPLSFSQCPLNYIYITGYDRPWFWTLQEIYSTRTNIK